MIDSSATVAIANPRRRLPRLDRDQRLNPRSARVGASWAASRWLPAGGSGAGSQLHPVAVGGRDHEPLDQAHGITGVLTVK
jgi:hypothetical protein